MREEEELFSGNKVEEDRVIDDMWYESKGGVFEETKGDHREEDREGQWGRGMIQIKVLWHLGM